MRSFDLSPLLRATVGFERMMDLLDSSTRFEEASTYPPYNIEKYGDDEYRITMAVAGFSEDELSVTLKDNTLSIEAKKEKENGRDATYLHRGIAERAFQRTFRLADHIKVTGARLENGLLHVELVREVPEEMKPRTIAIEAKREAQPQVLENQAA